MEEHERICELSFDEIYISQNIEIDRKEERRVGRNKTVQVGVALDHFTNWKQLFYYNFDKALLKFCI